MMAGLMHTNKCQVQLYRSHALSFVYTRSVFRPQLILSLSLSFYLSFYNARLIHDAGRQAFYCLFFLW